MSRSAGRCPYFKPAGARGAYPIQGYCEGSSAFGLRVPGSAELELFCKSSDYLSCPVYRFGTEADSNPGPRIEQSGLAGRCRSSG